MDTPRPPRTQEEISEIMRKVHSTGTSPEVAFRDALAAIGLADELASVDLPGKPDFVLPKHRLAVFIDGDYWHGNQWRLRGLTCLEDQFTKSKSEAREYWLRKIRRNMQRDAMSTAALLNEGWTVLRFWESDVRKRLGYCVEQVVNCTVNGLEPGPHSLLPFKSYVELQALTFEERAELDRVGWSDSFSPGQATLGMAITRLANAGTQGGVSDFMRLMVDVGARGGPRPPILALEYQEVPAYNLLEAALDPMVASLNEMGYSVDLLSVGASGQRFQERDACLLVGVSGTLVSEADREGAVLASQTLRPEELVEFITSHSDRQWYVRNLPEYQSAGHEGHARILEWLCTYYLNPLVNELIRTHALVGASSGAQ